MPEPSISKPDDVTQQVWDDHLKIRKVKKLPLTQTAFEEMSAQIDKAGLTLEGGLRYACGKNWASFDAGWYFKDNPQAVAVTARPQPQSFAERDREAGMKRWEEQTGRVHPDRVQPSTAQIIDITPTPLELAND